MDEDSSIRVVHFLNPHLIWVEVRKNDTFTLHQVGLFGVVPRQASLVDGERVCMKSDHWDPKANDVVEEFLETKHQLTFKSTYRLDEDDSPTSIFSNQPHIFGEILSSKKQDGTRKQLSNCLDNSVYAYKSKKEFWQMLTEGKIKTVLEDSEAIDVLQKIIQYYKDRGTWQRKKDIFFQHLTSSQAAKLQESSLPKLTAENIEKHLTQTGSQETAFVIEKSKPRHKSYQIFNGNKKEFESIDFVENVIKKYTVVETEDDIGDNLKQKAEILSKDAESDIGSHVSKITVYDEEIKDNIEEINNNELHDAIGRANSRVKRDARQGNTSNEMAKRFEKLVKLKQKCNEPVTNMNRSTDSIDSSYIDPQQEERKKESHAMVTKESHIRSRKVSHGDDVKISASRKSYERRLEEYEDTSSNASPSAKSEERLVAYGPPTQFLQFLVKKPLVKKSNKPAMKRGEHQGSTWKGNIDWDDEGENYFGGDLKCGISKEKGDDDSRNDSNGHSFVSKRLGKIDFNNSKEYNDYVQSKQDRRESKEMLKLRGDNKNSSVDEESSINNMSFRKTDQTSSNCKNTHMNPAKNDAKSRFLEMMRRKKVASGSINDSLSSTDDSSVYKQAQPNHTSTNHSKSSIESDEDLDKIHAKLNLEYMPLVIETKTKLENTENSKSHVNPYKNLDGSESVFVDGLVQPLILAHSKNDTKILPQSSLRDIPFKMEIHITLKNKLIKAPNRLQSVSWPYILRGHSVFMISAAGSGKSIGYLPAVCNLVLDYNFDFTGLGPICIIVCATALSVTDVARECTMFVNHQRVLTCFPGMDNKELITNLTNGCDILVSTPSMLYRLLGMEIGVDLRRLTTLVFEDCERLGSVYELEVKAIQLYVKQMLKSRTDKQVKVQYILASRKWCDFMTPLAKKAPDAIVTFTAFQECVLYSKINTTVSLLKKNKKVDAVVEFLKETEDSKLTVIVCRSDDEVDLLESTLKSLKFAVTACNNQMNIHDLYKLRTEKFSSILICCDGNLSCLCVTYANYLVHFSMPALYTQFCARFAVLNENYPSIFEPANEDIKIKILLEETNVEQLPKILHFVKRCSDNVPKALNEVARTILEQKDLSRAERLVPVCDSLLSLGECADMFICQERHAILKGYDEPKTWMPSNGIITFKPIHYNSAISYSARLLTHTTGNDLKKYPETYGTLCMKLGMFFSKEKNKRLHGEPKVGDICAVAIRKNFIARCQVLKVNNYEKGWAKQVVINLIDEEKITVLSAVELYHLPEEFKAPETHVVKVRLASIRPLDKDVTFSELAMNKLKRITDDDEQLYLKGRVAMVIGKTIFVDTLEVCADLPALCKTVVKYDFKQLLLEKYAIPNPDHLAKLEKLCDIGNLEIKHDPEVIIIKTRTIKRVTEPRWAHLDKNAWSEVIFSNTINAGKFFVRPQKFDECVNSLISDIGKYVENNTEQIEKVCVKDIVLAEFPDDSVYERAMIEEIIDDSKVKCFFVDNADWRDVAIHKLKPIPQKFIKQIPFQSIECRLIGIKPPSEDWSEFSTNWLHDNCLEDDKGNCKRLYVKYYTKEKAEVTGGHKYGILLVDTTTEEDLVINKRMIELNLAAVEEEEIEYLEKPLDFVREKTDTSSLEDDSDNLRVDVDPGLKNADERRRCKELIPIPIKLIPNEDEYAEWDDKNDVPVHNEKAGNIVAPYLPIENNENVPRVPLKKIFDEKPIRSFPLVGDDDEDLDKWDVCINEDLGKFFGLPKLPQSYNDAKNINGNDKMTVMTSKQHNKANISNLPAIAVKNDKDGTENKQAIQRKTTEIIGTRVREPIDTDVLKDVSLYDSDDTLSILSDNIGVTKEHPNKICSNKNEPVLDSDDTQSVSTEDDKELIDEFNDRLKNNVIDSDDSEIQDIEKSMTKMPKVIEIVTSNVLDKNRTNEINLSKVNGKVSEQLKQMKVCKTTKLKHIPITEVNKTQIATNDPEIKKEMNAYKNTITDKNKANKKDENMNVAETTKHNKTETIPNSCTESAKIIEKVQDELKTELKGKTFKVTRVIEPVRTPQLVWKQSKNTITIKIKLVVDEYILETGNRSLKFSANQNEVKYAFEIELYGVIESEKTKHSNKGQYILVTLVVMLKKSSKWLKLTKDSVKNWIIYDVDSIDTSSDEEKPSNDDALKIILNRHETEMEIEDDDDDIDDTSGYRYRNDY